MSVRRVGFSEDAGDGAPVSLNNPPCWIKCFLGSFGFISRMHLLKSAEECLGEGGQISEGNGTTLPHGQLNQMDFSPASARWQGTTVAMEKSSEAILPSERLCCSSSCDKA